MKNYQEQSPINCSKKNVEPIQIFPPSMERMSSAINQQKIKEIDGQALGKLVIFECEKCNGPLVPKQKCPVCQRAILRLCVKCKNESVSGSHLPCNYLMKLCGLGKTGN